MKSVFVGIGSNVGDRLYFIRKAIGLLDSHPDICVKKISPLYETEPYGFAGQSNFYNTVAEIDTELKPEDLLFLLKGFEKQTGRSESVKWGPREIDIDILLYKDIIYKSDNLSIPHNEMLKRDFVIGPLLDLTGEFIFPGTGELINYDYLKELKRHTIRKLNSELLSLMSSN